jgi:hypothetical protein
MLHAQHKPVAYDLKLKQIFFYSEFGMVRKGSTPTAPRLRLYDYFAWSLEPGAWSLEPGAWSLEPGAWSLEQFTPFPLRVKRLLHYLQAPSLIKYKNYNRIK